MKNTKNRALAIFNYNADFFASKYSTVYEDYLTAIINNFVLFSDIIDKPDLKSAFNFTPSTYLFAQLTKNLNNFAVKENLALNTKETINDYLNNLLENGERDYFLNFFLEIKEFKQYLRDTEKLMNYRDITTNLLNWYIEKSNNEQLILKTSEALLSALFSPRLDLKETFKNVKAEDINVFKNLKK